MDLTNNGQANNYTKLIKKLAKNQKTEALRGLLKDLDPVEIANSFLQLKLKHQLTIIGLLDGAKLSEVMSNMQEYEPLLEEIVKKLNYRQLGNIIEEMDKDDAVDMISMLTDEKANKVLDELPQEDRDEITHLLRYDEESAGGIMDPNVVFIRKELNVQQATEAIKAIVKKNDVQDFYVIYVIDEYRHLIGSISLTQLFLADKSAPVHEIMDPNVIAVNVDLDQEKVARLAREYDLVTVPVIDKHLKLVGRITSDDLMDVLEEEYQEDFGQIAGTGDEDVLETSVIKASKRRLPWLILGLIGGALAAFVMSGYESSISELPQVAYFIPVIVALGGNIAIQSSSLVVRGLATGELRTADLLKRTWKEVRVSMLNGIICAILLGLLAWMITDLWLLGMATAGALLITVLLAALVGTAVPMLLKRMHLDPAIATGPFITTTNDILGIIIYLAITFAVFNAFVQ
jgi:magnesium transporter